MAWPGGKEEGKAHHGAGSLSHRLGRLTRLREVRKTLDPVSRAHLRLMVEQNEAILIEKLCFRKPLTDLKEPGIVNL